MSGDTAERTSGELAEMIAQLEEDGGVTAPSRFRSRDSMGALRPSQAELDGAYARGYAHGQEEAESDALDHLRTVLVTVVESRFGELEMRHLDWIEAADRKQLSKALVSAHRLDDVNEILVD